MYDKDVGADVFVKGEFNLGRDLFLLRFPLSPYHRVASDRPLLPRLHRDSPDQLADFHIFLPSSSLASEVPSHDAPASSSWVDRMKVKGDWLEQKIASLPSLFHVWLLRSRRREFGRQVEFRRPRRVEQPPTFDFVG